MYKDLRRNQKWKSWPKVSEARGAARIGFISSSLQHLPQQDPPSPLGIYLNCEDLFTYRSRTHGSDRESYWNIQDHRKLSCQLCVCYEPCNGKFGWVFFTLWVEVVSDAICICFCSDPNMLLLSFTIGFVHSYAADHQFICSCNRYGPHRVVLSDFQISPVNGCGFCCLRFPGWG